MSMVPKALALDETLQRVADALEEIRESTGDQKADKVKNVVSGNFASLDSNGNLMDSGHKPSDYLTAQDITGKLDAPETTGMSGQLLRVANGGGTEWSDVGTPTDTQVGTAVSAWLSGHPEVTTTVQDGSISRVKLDSTLQTAIDDVGDLKTTFNGSVKVDNIDNKYNLLQRGNVVPKSFYCWHYGSIANDTGADNGTSPRRLRSDYLPVTANTEYNVVGSGYVIVHAYNSSKTWISMIINGYQTPEFTFTTPANTAYIRILLMKDSTGQSEFDTESVSNLNIACYPTSNELDEVLDELNELSISASGNVFDYFLNNKNATSNGITFTWDKNKNEYTVNGTSTGTASSPSRNTLFNTTLPDCLKRGGVYKLDIQSEDVENVYIYFTIRNGSLITVMDYTTAESRFIYIPKSADANGVTLRIDVKPGATVANKKISFRLEYQKPTEMPVHIKGITYNVGKYNYGLYPSVQNPVQATSKTLSELKEYFRTHPCDLFAAQENQINLVDSDLTTVTNMDDALYSYLFPYYFTSNASSGDNWPSLYSKYPIIYKWSRAFSDGRRYAQAVINIHGIPVLVLSVHLALNLEDREAQYAAIKQIVQGTTGGLDYAIVFGDLNAGNGVEGLDAQPEYTELIENGWHTANGGWWGVFTTHNSVNESDLPIKGFDSVLTTPNIDIYTYDAMWGRTTMPSDHRPLLCDLIIYPYKDGFSE